MGPLHAVNRPTHMDSEIESEMEEEPCQFAVDENQLEPFGESKEEMNVGDWLEDFANQYQVEDTAQVTATTLATIHKKFVSSLSEERMKKLLDSKLRLNNVAMLVNSCINQHI